MHQYLNDWLIKAEEKEQSIQSTHKLWLTSKFIWLSMSLESLYPECSNRNPKERGKPHSRMIAMLQLWQSNHKLIIPSHLSTLKLALTLCIDVSNTGYGACGRPTDNFAQRRLL